jgi:hypothetical protein
LPLIKSVKIELGATFIRDQLLPAEHLTPFTDSEVTRSFSHCDWVNMSGQRSSKINIASAAVYITATPWSKSFDNRYPHFGD